MNTIEMNHLTVGEIVTRDFRSSAIFKKAGIDFCCGGKQTLEEACKEKDIDLNNLQAELDELIMMPASGAHSYKDWDPQFLCDYIVNTHHKFVLRNLPDLVFYTSKIARVHGEKHPELVEIESLFSQINAELRQHLENEENVLFPAIRQMMASPSDEAAKTIRSEIERMYGEHDFAGGAMDQINKISNGYKVPADGCKTYQVAFQLLEQFEDDLHVHVHLENNILFPKALALTEKVVTES